MEADEHLVRSLFASMDYRPYAWYSGQKAHVSIVVIHTEFSMVRYLKSASVIPDNLS